MNKNALIILVVLVVLVGVGWFFASSQAPAPVTSDTVSDEERMADVTLPASSSDAMPGASTMTDFAGEVREFDIEATNFAFSLPEIRVAQGTKVTINLNVKEGFHDWVVDEFNAKTKQLGAGATETISFVADQTGTFEYYCSVGNHRQMGMVGKLVVE